MQVAAGLGGVEPSSMGEVLPLTGAITALGIVAAPLVRAGQRLDMQPGSLVALVGMSGMGPHNLLTEDGALLAPVELRRFVTAVVFIVVAVHARRRGRQGRPGGTNRDRRFIPVYERQAPRRRSAGSGMDGSGFSRTRSVWAARIGSPPLLGRRGPC